MKSQLNLQDKTSFAFEVGPSPNGRMLSICGTQYEAWDYDTYIYDALRIAGYWPEKDRTYKRIMSLRGWLRKNVQHGHDFPVNVRSLKGAKLLIDRIIKSEYQDEYWKEEREFQLKRNAEIFSNA